MAHSWMQRASLVPTRRLVSFFALSLFWAFASASAAGSEELTSASFRHQAGSVSGGVSAGDGALLSSAGSPVFSQSEVTVAGGPIAAPVGSATTLTTVWSGFWAIVSGSFAGLDLDGDLAQFFLDPDDDGDGLDDVHETGTGFFVSATNTGTSPTLVDSDGDGIADGAEVLAGTDPNDPLSGPMPAAVPSLSAPFYLILLALLLLLVQFSGGAVRRRFSC